MTLKIKFTTGKEIELTEQEARELWGKEVPVYPVQYPIYPTWPIYPNYPTIPVWYSTETQAGTCTTGSINTNNPIPNGITQLGTTQISLTGATL